VDFAANIGDGTEEAEEMPLQKIVVLQLVNYLNESS
nr:hypothetical protein [Tanacetum cinerariifolium]